MSHLEIHFYEVELLNKQRPSCCSIIHKSWDMLAFQFTMNTIPIQTYFVPSEIYQMLTKTSTTSIEITSEMFNPKPGGTSELQSLL